MRLTGIPKNITPEKAVFTLFTAGTLVFFGLFYCQHIYRREQMQLFEWTTEYFFKTLALNGGLAIYLGELLTQFFCVPAAGAAIITGLAILLRQLIKKMILAFSPNAQFTIVLWLPSMLYCLLLTDQYYYISGFIGLVFAATASVLYIKAASPSRRYIRGFLLIPALYLVAGGAYIVFTLSIIISEALFSFKERNNKSLSGMTGIVLLFGALATFIPYLARKILITDTALQSFLSEAYYAVRIFFPLPLVIVFVSIPVLLAVFGFLISALPEKTERRINIVIGTIMSVFAVVGFLHYPDFREEKEMAYENRIYSEKWGMIIKAAETEQPSGQLPMTAVNLALAQTGQLFNRMFNFDQDSNDLFIPYVRRGMTPFTAGEPCYYLGLYNFSRMFAMETIESTVDAKLPLRSVRRVAETYLLNGQYDLARKYLTPVSHTAFYSRWANRYLGLMDSVEKISNDPLITRKRKFMLKYDFFYDYRKMDIALKYLLVSDPENKLAYDYLMAYYLLKKDLDGFLQNLSLARQMGYTEAPPVFQEAIVYILTRLHDPSPELWAMVTDQKVINNLRAYAKLYSENRQDTTKIKKEFGNTYWYYLHYK